MVLVRATAASAIQPTHFKYCAAVGLSVRSLSGKPLERKIIMNIRCARGCGGS